VNVSIYNFILVNLVSSRSYTNCQLDQYSDPAPQVHVPQAHVPQVRPISSRQNPYMLVEFSSGSPFVSSLVDFIQSQAYGWILLINSFPTHILCKELFSFLGSEINKRKIRNIFKSSKIEYFATSLGSPDLDRH
jgi:hypothetical protein